MYRLSLIGRVFFALALIGLGAEHFVFGDFITGRAPKWPEAIPGQTAWAYASGAVVILTGISILTGKKARIAGVLTALLILVWALLRHIPVVAGDQLFAPTWTAAGKALALFGGILAVIGTMPKTESSENTFVKFANLDSKFVLLGRICLGIFLTITGVQHFIYTEFVASLIPAWFLGDAVFWTYFGGVALIAGGVGLFIPYTARLAAALSGLMVFSWFWIIHIPRTLASVSDGIAVFEALAVAGIAFTIAGFLHQPGDQPQMP